MSLPIHRPSKEIQNIHLSKTNDTIKVPRRIYGDGVSILGDASGRVQHTNFIVLAPLDDSSAPSVMTFYSSSPCTCCSRFSRRPPAEKKKNEKKNIFDILLFCGIERNQDQDKIMLRAGVWRVRTSTGGQNAV